MSKFELSIAPDYVPSWTVVDAVRELFQNAIDQEVVTSDNEMFYSYSHEVLTIGNKKSVLEISSLLLGGSTKVDDDNTIGKFGEGYKIAALVLCRLGKSITFYNYGKKEVWKPRFVNSRRYGTQVLTFFVEKYIWKSVPDANLTIEIQGITEDEWAKISESNLHISKPKEVIQTEYGDILLDDDTVGKVFVNGLYVCNYNYHKGYNFKPSYIKLDRDRKLVSDFDLQWLASKCWAKVPFCDTFMDLLKRGATDVRFVSSHGSDFAYNVYQAFIDEHGPDAVPVYDNTELQLAKASGRRPILVSESYATLVKCCGLYNEEKIASPVERLEEWFDSIKYKLSDDEIEVFYSILGGITW